jgi:thiol-disulfide isomerase/thioredoxin
MRYRFQHLALPLVLKDMYFSEGDPGPGDRVPDFDLPLLGGGRFRSRDLAETGPALVMFGSGTCPVTDNAAPGLNALHRRFGARVRFVVVNVREAHPGKVEFEVAVDDIDGTLHRALSPKPNSAYVLAADGTILFRAQWANATEALAAALESVVAGEPSRRSQSGGLVRPMLRMLRNIAPALDRAGSGAWADMWLVAPPLAALALALKALHVRPAQGPLPATRPARAGAVPSQGR